MITKYCGLLNNPMYGGNLQGYFTPYGQLVPFKEDVEKQVYEDTLWHYCRWVRHSIKGLAELCGDHNQIAKNLKCFFENGFYMHPIEPYFHYPFLL